MKKNNFPREGMHTPITRNAVKRLERERPVHNAEPHYTIGGDVETNVHSCVYAEREAAITNGSRRLNYASDKVRSGFDVARSNARTEYIRIQKQAAQNHPARNVGRDKGPSR